MEQGNFASLTSFPLSSLLCHENEACLTEKLDEEDKEEEENKWIELSPFIDSSMEDEYVEMMVQREAEGNLGIKSNTCPINKSCPTTRQSWLKCVRMDAIKWILNIRAVFGFHLQTAFLSVSYFDRFLSRRSIDNGKIWAIRLLSMACLSLAVKMEEIKAPLLSDYPMEDYEFENSVIQRMELMVLNALEWRLVSVTPFAYLHYFINKFCDGFKPKGLVSRAVEFVMNITQEINLIDYPSSTIAAAAVLAAYDGQLDRKTVGAKLSLISSWGSIEHVHTFSCYIMMQEIEMSKCKTPLVISPAIWSIHSSSIDFQDSSHFTSSIGTKRRLTFNDPHQDQSLKKLHKQ